MKKNEHVWLTNLDIGLRKICSLPFCSSPVLSVPLLGSCESLRFSSPVLSVPLLGSCESLRFRGGNNHGRWRKRSLEQRHSLDLFSLDWASFDLILPTPLGLSFLVGQHVLCSSEQRGQRANWINGAV